MKRRCATLRRSPQPAYSNR